jgi:uncharacterized protein (DUF697 family)
MSEHPVAESFYDQRVQKANDIVKDYALWSGGFGLLPLPIIDFAVITATQVKMIYALSNHYSEGEHEKRHWSHERIRALISSLVGSGVPVATGAGLGSLLKAIPIVGTALGTITTPALAWTSTVALGRIFIKHFETGGTLLDFDPEKMRHYYYEQFEAAKHGRPVEVTPLHERETSIAKNAGHRGKDAPATA